MDQIFMVSKNQLIIFILILIMDFINYFNKLFLEHKYQLHYNHLDYKFMELFIIFIL